MREWRYSSTHSLPRHYDSSVSVVIELRAGRPGFDYREGRDYFLHHRVETDTGAHPASYLLGTERYFTLGMKLPGREADRSPQFSSEIKNSQLVHRH
jgi:hypothetical protein